MVTNDQNQIEKIWNFVVEDAIKNPTREMIEINKDVVQIHRFSGTKLSNFYPVWVEYNNTVYPSVEHAYQAQKFNVSDLKNLTAAQHEELAEMLKCKGCATPFPEHIANFFTDRNFTSGNIKMVVGKLQEYGYGTPHWEGIKGRVMVDLLVQKWTENDLLSTYLKSTGSSYLVEGNTWHDNYWGYHDETGCNYLGRVIMYIRDGMLSKEE